MPDFPNFNDLWRTTKDELLSRNAKLSLEAAERDGSDVNVLTAACAAAGDEVVAQLVDVCAGQFLDSAEGQALDRLVFDRYGLIRKPAAPAFGSVSFTTTVATVTAFTIPQNTILQTADGIQFITSAVATFPASSTGPVVVAVRSTLAGANQQAKIGTITSIVGTIASQPATLTVTNTMATSGADDEESDEALRDRARRFFVTARRGTLAALEQGALAVSGVRKATAIEVIDVKGRPARLVQLIVSDAFTDALVNQDSNPATYQTQSQSLTTTVFNALSDVRAAGMYVQVLVAQVVLQPINLQLQFTAGVSVDDVALTARATLVAYTNSLSPGVSWVLDDALAALATVNGLEFSGNEILSPQGDVVPAALQVIRTSLNLVTATSNQSDQPIAATTNPDEFIIRSLT